MGASVGNKGFVSEINVTPFVDVMLVLLIIFMVTAPMLTEGLEVDLPETKQVETLDIETEHLVLTIQRDGAIFLDNYPLTMEDLESRLAILVKDKQRALFLQADKDVPYGVVVNVMGQVRAAGIENLGIVAHSLTELPGAAGSKATTAPVRTPAAISTQAAPAALR